MNPRKPLILVLDDEEALRLVLKEELDQSGYDVVTFCMKGDGLAWLKTHKPDLVLSDIKSPDIDGLEFMRILRQDPATRDTKVVILSAFYTAQNEEMAARYGAMEFIRKPYDLDDLRVRVQNLLDIDFRYNQER